MNTILQKRIEEATEAIVEDYNHYQFLNDGTKDVYTQSAVLFMLNEMAQFIISSQWISVEEALPEMTDEDMEWSDIVLIKCKYCEDMKPCIMTSRYDVGTGFWLNPVAREITHWMEIPSLKGGEK